MCVGGRKGAVGGRVRGDVGAGVACSLRNFYATRASNFYQFRVGGFKHGIGNLATKRRWMHSTITGSWVLLPPEDLHMIRWWTQWHTVLTFGIETKRNCALRKLRKAQFQYSDWKEANLSSMVNNKAHRFTLKESQTVHLENIRKAQCRYSWIERNPTWVPYIHTE